MCCRIALILSLISSAAIAGSDKPNFSGNWRMEASKSEAAPIVTINQNENELRISSAPQQKESTDVTCNTMGKQCEATMDGDRVKVSYYYNGPMLVEMVFEGKNNERVTKTRRTLSEDGQKMTLEVIPMVPAGKDPYKLVFVRDQQVPAAPTTSEARH